MKTKTVVLLRSVTILLLSTIFTSSGALHPATAQEKPEYQFLLRIWDDSLFRLDCDNKQCTTYSIPLPLTDQCPFYDTMAPTPDGERILLKQICYGTNPQPKIYLMDLAGSILAEYEIGSYTAWWAAQRLAYWSSDETFIVLSQATGPGSFALSFYDPARGFSDTFRVGGRFAAFSPDGTRMLFMIQSDRSPLVGEPAIAYVAHVSTFHELSETLLRSKWPTLQKNFEALGWLSNHTIRLATFDLETEYMFDLGTGELTLLDPLDNPLPDPYNGGIQARRTGNTVTIWDTNTGTQLEEMTFALPDGYEIDLATCEHCIHYWLNPPR